MAILFAYWLLMTLVPAPGIPAGALGPVANLADWIDRAYLPGRLWFGDRDPAGRVGLDEPGVEPAGAGRAGRAGDDVAAVRGLLYRVAPVIAGVASALLALALLATGGCSSLKFWDKDKGEKVIEGSPEQLYRDAIKDIKNNNYAAAIQRYEMLEARYPFSEQAKQGQLDLIYAYYKNRSADAAIDQADQFIRENPTHPRVDYAYYVRGLVYFESGANWLERKFKADIAKRPPHEASKSFQSFQVLVQQYPKSPYSADARQRMIFLRNRLADYEIAVARFYLKRGAYVGAANKDLRHRATPGATSRRMR
jgi:outer membrane protein assembly factor BamD